MHCRLGYGRTGLDLEITDPARVTLVERPRAARLPDPHASVRAALLHPIGAPSLAEVARGRRDAVVVVSDKTRPVPNAVVLPPILETLEEAGIARDAIEILVATGLHRANTRDELIEMTSPEIVDRYRIRNHAARDRDQHLYLGATARGTEIWLDRGFLAADLKIVTGLIEPHLMAGYSGGRKGVVPGLAGVDTMRSLHGARMLEQTIGPGILEENPFHQELVEIARRARVDFLVNAAIDRRRRPTGIFAGDLERAHAEGCRLVERQVRVDLEHSFEVVVASAGGYPLDTTLYQTIKGLVAALNVVRRGGTIVLAAEISEGIGSAEFRRLLDQLEGPDEFMERITSPGFFSIDQWMLQHLCQVLRKARVAIVSPNLDPEPLRRLGIDQAPSVEAAVESALDRHGRDARIAVLPEGPYVLATVRGRKLAIGRAWMDEAA